MLVAFGHRKQVGKDTAGAYINQMFARSRKIGFAEPIYRIAQEIYAPVGFKRKLDYERTPGLKEKKLSNGISPRKILLEIGRNMRAIDPDTWVRLALDGLELKFGEHVLITDLRFPNEFKAVRDAGGICIKINRNLPNTDDPADSALAEETNWDDELDNNGSMKDFQHTIFEKVVRRMEKHG